VDGGVSVLNVLLVLYVYYKSYLLKFFVFCTAYSKSKHNRLLKASPFIINLPNQLGTLWTYSLLSIASGIYLILYLSSYSVSNTYSCQ